MTLKKFLITTWNYFLKGLIGGTSGMAALMLLHGLYRGNLRDAIATLPLLPILPLTWGLPYLLGAAIACTLTEKKTR